MRLKYHVTIVLALALAAGSVTAQDDANNKLPPLIDGVVAAYGGKALTGIRNYTVTARYVAAATGQSWTPQLDDVGRTT
jgi:hypothetical protein